LLTNGVTRKIETRQQVSEQLAYDWLGNELGTLLVRLWEQELWIPQESLGFEQLLALKNSELI
jgi:hypothetical protein